MPVLIDPLKLIYPVISLPNLLPTGQTTAIDLYCHLAISSFPSTRTPPVPVVLPDTKGQTHTGTCGVKGASSLHTLSSQKKENHNESNEVLTDIVLSDGLARHGYRVE